MEIHAVSLTSKLKIMGICHPQSGEVDEGEQDE